MHVIRQKNDTTIKFLLSEGVMPNINCIEVCTNMQNDKIIKLIIEQINDIPNTFFFENIKKCGIRNHNLSLLLTLFKLSFKINGEL